MWTSCFAAQAARAAICLLRQPPGSSTRFFSSGSGGGKSGSGDGRWKGAWPWAAVVPWLLVGSGCVGGHLAQADEADKKKERVVVLGTGWGGISFLKGLDTNMYDLFVISPRNYFVFTPLLPSVTAGTVEARSISEPVRRLIYNERKNATFVEAECIKIDAEKKWITCTDTTEIKTRGKESFTLEYDYLVVAVGAECNTFGTPGVKEYCHFLKEVEDAQKIRDSIVDCFETSCLPHLTKEEKDKLLHFVVVGGGPTGVEFAAELHDLIYEDLVKFYPHLKEHIKITLVQSGDHILNTFDDRISQFAEQKFQRDGVDVKTHCRVLGVTDKDISFLDKSTGKMEKLPYGMVVWSTGIGTRGMIADFMEQINQHDRRALATDEWLRVKGCKDVFAIGDCATVEQRKIAEDISYLFKMADKNNDGVLNSTEFFEVVDQIRERYPQIDVYLKRQHLRSIINLLDGAIKDKKPDSAELDIEAFKKALCHADSQMKTFPATAQVAAQQGEYLSHVFNNMCKCAEEPEGPLRIRGAGRHRFHPFRYKHLGQFAPLGGEQAAAELPGDWVSIGRSTQWLWYSVYLSKQVSWRTKCLVLFDWTKRSIFGRDSSRM